MATNRAMLKEAIADAKAVKETAIANAKAALEEAFTPQLQSMLSMKLQEMNDLEEDDFEETYNNTTMEEVDLEELLAELEEEETMEEDLYEAEENEEDMEMSDEESEEDEAEPIDLEDMTDEDLKSMIEDVIADMIKSGELEAGSEGEESEESEEEEVDLAELLREIEEMEEMDYMEEEKEPVDEVSATGLSNLGALAAIAGTMLTIGIPAIKTYLEYSKKLNLSKLEQAELILDMAKNPEYYKKEVKKAEEADESTPKISEISTKMDSESMNSKSMNSELYEAYSTIKILKSELNEINLLNAKLLYTNKIFKAKNLNESQKVKVLTSFDRAKNVGEVKMVFETLNEGIKVSKNIIKENLGRASKGTMTPNVKKPIVESNEAFLRMQKLAGII